MNSPTTKPGYDCGRGQTAQRICPVEPLSASMPQACRPRRVHGRSRMMTKPPRRQNGGWMRDANRSFQLPCAAGTHLLRTTGPRPDRGCRREPVSQVSRKTKSSRAVAPAPNPCKQGMLSTPAGSAAALVEGPSGSASAPHRATTLAELHRPCAPWR